MFAENGLSVRTEEAEQMRMRSLSLVLSVSLAGGLLTIGASPVDAMSSLESCFFSSINAERASVRRASLVLKGDLVSMARNHSRRMAEDGTIYHNRNLSSEISGSWWAVGENVGMGPSCETLHNAFMASTGHRANIVDRDYNQGGVGIAMQEDTIYVTEVFAGRRSPSTIPRATPAPRPRPKPKPAARPLRPEPRTVDVLLFLVGLDAKLVDPASGAAMGV